MKCFLFILLISVSTISYSQDIQRPKLVVGLVVDQMRWDYLYRYFDRFGHNGFKRLIREGFSCENTFIPYTPTYTAAGHTCVYTGSVPALHGIMGNNWFDRKLKRVVYCTEDAGVSGVGSTSAAGKMSPVNMWSSTITDELRLATNFRSKTIAIALKDRGAILPGGHSSNGSFWFDDATGGWITSTYFMNELPDWLKKFNEKKLPDSYLKKNWNTLYRISSYNQSTADSNNYEGKPPGGDFTFPHITDHLTANKYQAFRVTPFADAYTFETAKAAIRGESLGSRNVTDFLALSFSAPDYIGHTFGSNSIEVEDEYLRFDKSLEDFLYFLDSYIGKGRYLLFLTADHGAAHNPLFLEDKKISSGVFEQTKMKSQLTDSLEKYFHNRSLVSQIINYQVYLDDSAISHNNINRDEVKKYIMKFLLNQPSVSSVTDLADLQNTPLPEKLKNMLVNGYNQKLSGDIQVIYKPQWFENWSKGTTHGMWNPYDSHIPLLWYGWNIKKGSSNREVYMTDIAPTLAALLHIQMPNASVGNVIEEVIR